ncbi:MAG TPA: hypothetical protein VES88_08975 [Gemmatimonadaceae bacterium]|nr:hypothetical protein [Gemmatimonadaceae bacterium]
MPVLLDTLGDFLAVLAGPVTGAMEATLYWQRLHDRAKNGRVFILDQPR